MSNFVIFKAAFNNSVTPAIGTYTAEGAPALFNQNSNYGSSDYYLYNYNVNTLEAVQWFVPTKETTDFEFVADILSSNLVYSSTSITYFIIADSSGTTKLRMWSKAGYASLIFENSDSTAESGDPEYIGSFSSSIAGWYGKFHRFRVRVHKLTESSSSVEVYVDGELKLTATAGAALVTCAKLGFVGGANTSAIPGVSTGIKNVYVYDLSDKPVIDRSTLSEAFNKFIDFSKSNFALKRDLPSSVASNPVLITEYSTNQPTSTLTIASLVPYKPVTVYMYFAATSSGIVKLNTESEASMIVSKQIEPGVTTYSTPTLWSYRGTSGNVKLYALLIPLGNRIVLSLSNLSYPVQIRAYQ